MKTPKNTENMLRQYFDVKAAGVEPNDVFDERVLDDARQANEQSQKTVMPDTGITIWRFIITNTYSRYAAILLASLALISGIFLIDRSASPAYAIEQTIKAMETIRTVYFEAKFYKQGGPVECWMIFDGKHSKPTHVCLYAIDSPMKIVDTPEKSFVYNNEINCYMNKTRDERRANWYPNFTKFFAQSLKEASANPNIVIVTEFDQQHGREVVVIAIDEQDRELRYIVDAETKLPLQFTTVRMDNWMKYLNKTIAVESMTEIRYNEPVPEGIFRYPDNAEEVTNEHDVYLSAKDGMVVGNMTDAEACKALIKEVVEAMNKRDWKRVTELYFPFVEPPEEAFKQMNLPADKPLVKLTEIGEPQRKGEYWYIYTEAVEFNGNIKNETVPIKFYTINGVRYCRVMFPD